MCGVTVEFFGDATHVDTSAAQPRAGQTTIFAIAAVHATRLGQSNFGSALCRHTGSAHAAAAAANDEEVEIVAWVCIHGVSLFFGV